MVAALTQKNKPCPKCARKGQWNILHRNRQDYYLCPECLAKWYTIHDRVIDKAFIEFMDASKVH